MKRIAIIGATSGMAEHTARCFAQDTNKILLIGRNADKVQSVADDLSARGAEVATDLQDLLKLEALPGLISRAWERWGGLDYVLIAHGVLGDQEAAQSDLPQELTILHANFTSAAILAGDLANRMEAQGHGVLAVIGSVAGDRGRQSNYIYGAAKSGIEAYLSGLRNRLFKKGVAVVTIKPGFVATPMTAHLKQGPLFISGEKAGKLIHRAMIKRKSVAYVPWFWRGIMGIICHIPEFVFKRLSL